MFWTEFGIVDQGGNLVFIRKKGNTVSYHGCSKGSPGQERDKTRETVLGVPCRGWVMVYMLPEDTAQATRGMVGREDRASLTWI